MDNNNDNEVGETITSNDSTLENNDHLARVFMSDDEYEALSSANEDFVCSSPSSDEMNSADVAEQPLPSVLLKPQPKHKWSIVKEVIQRENGSHKMHQLFPQRFYSSLHAVQRLELMYKLEKHSGCVNAINFNPSGTTLISGSDDTTVVVWDWRVGKCLSSFQTGHTSNVFQCKFLPLSGDIHIVTCSRDGQVRLATRNSIGGYESTTRLTRHSEACHKLATLPHTPHVFLSAGEDGWVHSMDVREKDAATRILCVKEKSKKVSLYSIHAHPMTGNEICLAGNDFRIRLYDRRCIKKDGSNVIKFFPSSSVRPILNEDDPAGSKIGKNPFIMNISYVTCAVFNYNGSEIIGSYNDDDIYLFDTKCSDSTKYAHKYEGHCNGKTVKGVNFFGPKSEFIVSGSDCGNIYFWDKNTESIVQWMRGDEDGVINCLEPHPSIPVLASSGLDSDVKIWVPSCETEPKMTGLKKTVASNQKKKNSWWSQKLAFSNDLVRWWKEFGGSNRPACIPSSTLFNSSALPLTNGSLSMSSQSLSSSSLSSSSPDSSWSSSSSLNLDPMGSDSDDML